jgi:hypothetical protein
MFYLNVFSDLDPLKHLDYHKELLKKSEQMRLIREVMQVNEKKPLTSHKWEEVWQYLLRLRPGKHTPLITRS